MKCIDVTMFELSKKELNQIAEGTQILVYDTLKSTLKIVENSDKAVFNSPDFNENRFVLLLFTQQIYKNSEVLKWHFFKYH